MKVDVLIVGLGPAGATVLAKLAELANSGISI
jgi:flavin-dependent dehydrogenase